MELSLLRSGRARGVLVVLLLAALLPTGGADAQLGTSGGAVLIEKEGEQLSNAEIAVAMAEETFTDPVQRVLIGRDDEFADSMTSAVLQRGAPLLLVPPGGPVPADVMALLRRHQPDEVVVLGGERAVARSVEDTLAAEFAVSRRAGLARFQTAVAIARQDAPDADTAIIARAFHSGGDDPTQAFADSLAAGGWASRMGWPMLLTETERLTDVTAEHLRGSLIRRVKIVGGTAAVGAGVEQALRDMGMEVERIAGGTRFETAVEVAKAQGAETGADVDHIILTEGQDADAWAGGFTAASRADDLDAVIVLAAGDVLPEETREWLSGGPTTSRTRQGELPPGLTCVNVHVACEEAEAIVFGEQPLTPAETPSPTPSPSPAPPPPAPAPAPPAPAPAPPPPPPPAITPAPSASPPAPPAPPPPAPPSATFDPPTGSTINRGQQTISVIHPQVAPGNVGVSGPCLDGSPTPMTHGTTAFVDVPASAPLGACRVVWTVDGTPHSVDYVVVHRRTGVVVDTWPVPAPRADRPASRQSDAATGYRISLTSEDGTFGPTYGQLIRVVDTGDSVTVDGQAGDLDAFRAQAGTPDLVTYTQTTGGESHALRNRVADDVTSGIVGNTRPVTFGPSTNVRGNRQELFAHDVLDPWTGTVLRTGVTYADTDPVLPHINEGDVVRALASAPSGVEVVDADLVGRVMDVQQADPTRRVAINPRSPADEGAMRWLGDVPNGAEDSVFVIRDCSSQVTRSGPRTRQQPAQDCTLLIGGQPVSYQDFAAALSVGDTLRYSRTGGVETFDLTDNDPVILG